MMATPKTPRQRASDFLTRETEGAQIPIVWSVELQARLTQTIKQAQIDILEQLQDNCAHDADKENRISLDRIELIAADLRNDLNL